MPTTSTRTVIVSYEGDIEGTFEIDAASNGVSPGQTDLLTLAAGDTTITVPTGGSVPAAVVILPPDGNTVAIVLKGAVDDVGLLLHKTDPTVISLDSSQASFILNTASILTGLRLLWA